MAVCNSVMATFATVWAFRQHPNFIFCSSPTDPCSCTGGGFDIFAAFCNKSNSSNRAGNATNGSSGNISKAVDVAVADALTAHVSILDAVDDNAIVIFISIGALIVVILIFGQARALIEWANANDARAIAEAKVVKLRETNLKVREELKLAGLNKQQVKIVKEQSSRIADIVSSVYKLNWNSLKFQKRLGSGTFGDCYKGTRAGRPVAIKKMRAGESLAISCAPSD